MVDKLNLIRKEDGFIVHIPSKIIQFKRGNNGLYYYNTTEIQNDNVMLQLLCSLEDKKI